jgi:hypothetical protein
LKVVVGLALATPFSLMSCLAFSDLLHGASNNHSRAMPCGIVAIGCGVIVGFGAASGNVTPSSGSSAQWRRSFCFTSRSQLLW